MAVKIHFKRQWMATKTGIAAGKGVLFVRWAGEFFPFVALR